MPRGIYLRTEEHLKKLRERRNMMGHPKQIVTDGAKVCSRCKQLKKLTEYHKTKKHHTGYKSHCKECSAKLFHSWKQKNLEREKLRDRIRHYIRKYGFSETDAIALVTDRKGYCKICGEYQELVVDHSHTTKMVRGMICSPCNCMLGYSREDIDILEKAIEYLKEHTDAKL